MSDTVTTEREAMGLPGLRGKSGVTPSPAPGTVTDGGAGLGDPYYPYAGNSGYDVTRYQIMINWDPTTETLQVIPATSGTSGGTCSILTRTGIRCASRTQVKIGSTFGRPWVLLAAFAALMPAVMLSIFPLIGDWKPSSAASTGSPTWMLARPRRSL